MVSNIVGGVSVENKEKIIGIPNLTGAKTGISGSNNFSFGSQAESALESSYSTSTRTLGTWNNVDIENGYILYVIMLSEYKYATGASLKMKIYRDGQLVGTPSAWSGSDNTGTVHFQVHIFKVSEMFSGTANFTFELVGDTHTGQRRVLWLYPILARV